MPYTPIFDFDIPVGEHGDTYDRYMVRIEEMRQSARIVAQAVEKIPRRTTDGKAVEDHQATDRRYLSLDRSAERRTGLLHRERRKHAGLSRARAASILCESSIIEEDGQGHMVADVVAIIGTLDIVLGEIDR